MRGLIFSLFVVLFIFASAQQNISIHQSDAIKYSTEPFADTLDVNAKSTINTSCNLTKRVFGWHPSWVGGVYSNYQWNLLSDLCYFSYEFNASTGNPTNTNGWFTAAVIDTAKAHGTKVHLCVTMFLSSDHTTFFGSTTAQTNLITNLVNAVETRDADGIDLDFEGVSSTHKAALTTFVQRIADSLHTRIPGAELTIAMPAVDWGGTWDLPALNPYVDLFIIMGYDYYYGGSPTAGPTDPLYPFESATSINYSKTITYYLNGGVTPSKLLMAVPYYGFQWQTTNLSIPSSTLATGTSKTYATVMTNASGNYSNANKHWEPNSLSNYWAFSSTGLNYQCWVDDARAMSRRFDLINIRDIGGIGIWALGYDNGYDDFWNLIADKFSDCAVVPCTDTIWDLGGPNWPHLANEDFQYTIAPTGASNVNLDFSNFYLEANYDTLWIYDGPTTAANLIGGFSGTTSPGNIVSTGNALTLRFHSDVATQYDGWTAIWTCSTDNQPPITSIQAPSGWQTQDFTTSFTDTDNFGLQQSFWQVLQYDGNQWKGNAKIGFLNDNFDAALPTDWTNYLGSWNVDAAHLFQSDSSLSNTNFGISLPQNGSNVWLYHWQLKFGAGDATVNRRAGIHYFCSDVSQSNRENNYMAYFRLDNQKVQLYEYVNNTYYLQTDVSYAFAAGVWYDVKVMYNPATGYNAAWVNDVLVSSWTDATPLTSGTGFSLRVGNSKAWFDDVKVYKSRTMTETVTVGPDSLDMVQWQNPNPSTPSCRLKSLVLDEVNLFSNLTGSDVNIDYTAPGAPSFVNDEDTGSGDLDVLYFSGVNSNNVLCGSSNDSNSGISAYFFNFGLSCGTDSMYSYSMQADTAATLGLFGADGMYYSYVFSVNGAGLVSDTVCSDGILVDNITSVYEMENNYSVFPNPAENTMTLNFPGSGKTPICITTTDGRQIKQECCTETPCQIDISALAPGCYVLEILDESVTRIMFVKR